jgi:hypothetical protein
VCKFSVVNPVAAVPNAAVKAVVTFGRDTVAFIRIVVYDMLQNAVRL